jgi:hypothetical protein
MIHTDKVNIDIQFAVDDAWINRNIRGAIVMIFPSNPPLTGDECDHSI